MDKYVVTFYSHYGALTFCKSLKAIGVTAKPSPVPRKLSSSCGICVQFAWSGIHDLHNLLSDDIEAIYLCNEGGYSVIIKN